MKVTWRELRDFVRIEMVAGPPETLALPGWDPEEVSSDHSFKTCAILLKLVVLFLLKQYMLYLMQFSLCWKTDPKFVRDEMNERKDCDTCDRFSIGTCIEYLSYLM